MIDNLPLKLLHADGSITTGRLRGGVTDPDRHVCRLEFEHPFLAPRAVVDFDLFRCLRQLRLDLEREGAQPLCNGARPNAFVSAMASQMGYGLQVYLLQKGTPIGDQRSLVPLFGEASPEAIGSVAAQDAFQDAHWKEVAAPAQPQ